MRTAAQLKHEIRSDQDQLLNHPLYASLNTVSRVRVFMEHHVFAVWDFMSLLKGLQRQLTCVDVPWIPRADAHARRLINEIVLGEESDAGFRGGYASHFELYLAAMRESGADVTKIEALIACVSQGTGIREALALAEAPAHSRQFVESTFSLLEANSLPRIAGAFAVGRESLVPEMFVRLVAALSKTADVPFTRFLDYLERHIHVDGVLHAPMSARMLESICGDDRTLWNEAERGAREALAARLGLWDGVLQEVRKSK